MDTRCRIPRAWRFRSTFWTLLGAPSYHWLPSTGERATAVAESTEPELNYTVLKRCALMLICTAAACGGIKGAPRDATVGPLVQALGDMQLPRAWAPRLSISGPYSPCGALDS